MYTRLFILVAAVFPSVALAAPRTFGELANFLAGFMNNFALVLITAALAIYFWGIAKNVTKFGDAKGGGGEKMRSYFLWGIIVLFVMVSLSGILRVLENTLFGGANASTVLQGSSSGSACGSFADCGQ